MSDSTHAVLLAALSFFGGLGLSFVFVYTMDCCSKPAERRRQLELATRRATRANLRQQVLERLFPEQLYDGVGTVDPGTREKDDVLVVPVVETTAGTDESPDIVHSKEKEGEETAIGETVASVPTNEGSGVESCAICIEPIQRNDSIIVGKVCQNHICHRICVLEWLKNHNDCPVCREPMWTTTQFVTVKRTVLEEDPEALAREMEQFAKENRQGLVVRTNHEPDDIVIDTLNSPGDQDDIEANAGAADENDAAETEAVAAGQAETAGVAKRDEDNLEDTPTAGNAQQEVAGVVAPSSTAHTSVNDNDDDDLEV